MSEGEVELNGELGVHVFWPLQGGDVLIFPEICELFDVGTVGNIFCVGTLILVGHDNKSLIRWFKTPW